MKKNVAIFLCDITGVMAKPWVEAGYEVILVDPQHPVGITHHANYSCGHVHPKNDDRSMFCRTCLDEGVEKSIEIRSPGTTTIKVGHIIDHPATWSVLLEAIQTGRVAFVAGFPPCTDLAVSGARWFQAKREADPAIQFKAMQVVWQCQTIGELSGAPWFLENPVSQISSLWRKPDHSFHPHYFTGYCANDNYTKKTCLWVGGGFVMPAPFADEALGAPDNRIHQAPPGPDRANFRSATPEGFARAVFLANHKSLDE